LELDENVSEAHSVIGLVKLLIAWDWSGAEREFKKAIELNPYNPTAHHWYSIMLYSAGRLDETIGEIKKAQELDPLSLIINVNGGLVLQFMRRYDDAIEQFKKTLELNQNYAATHVFLGNVYYQKSMVAEAIAECQKASLLIGSSNGFELGWLGYAFARTGMVRDAEQLLNKLLAFSKQGYVLSHGIALVYNGLGKMDEALEWLEKAFEDRDTFVRAIMVDPAMDNLRSEPRFIALLQKMGLKK
jgi:tetratricopeptide (TPR) repeat protein